MFSGEFIIHSHRSMHDAWWGCKTAGGEIVLRLHVPRLTNEIMEKSREPNWKNPPHTAATHGDAQSETR